MMKMFSAVGVWLPWLVIALLTLAGSDPLAASDPPASSEAEPTLGLEQPWQSLPADVELLRRVAAEGELRGGSPRPGLAYYFSDLATAAFAPLAGWMGSIGGPLADLIAWFGAAGLQILLWLILALFILAVLWHFRRLFNRWQKGSPGGAMAMPAPRPTSGAVAEWELRLQQRLDSGDARGALEALWWSLAIRLVGTKADPAWTSRELVEQAGRRDLLPEVRRLDQLVWGSEQPLVEDVRQLWGRLRQAVS